VSEPAQTSKGAAASGPAQGSSPPNATTAAPAMPGRREILQLALPALGALAAEPLYLLADTAIVGHLGSAPLAGLAVAGTALSSLLAISTFLEYGTTGAVARLLGAGRRAEALDTAVQATYLAVATGLLIALLLELIASPLLDLLGGSDTAIKEQGIEWLRIAALGAPFVCVTLAGQGWLRGMRDTVTPFVVIISGNVVSAALSAALVYGAHMGIRGSAIANAVAQTGSAVIFAWVLHRRGARMQLSLRRARAQLVAARDLSVRTLAFLGSFTVATAVAAHIGGPSVAAHQIAIQLWSFLAYSLDSLAIAAQAMVGGAVGSGAIAWARALSWRLVRWGTIVGIGIAVLLLAGFTVIPRLFTSDPAVLDAVHHAWPWFAGMMPAAGAVFSFDGIFIGAGDTRFLGYATTVAGLVFYVPLALAAGAFGWGLGGVWMGLTAFIVVRLVVCVWRLRGDAWYVAGRRHVEAVTALVP
jgi:putative MATE family efflux protein